MSDDLKPKNYHVNADVDKNRQASDARLHTPKGFKLANPGEQFFRLDDNTPFYFASHMPPPIDVDQDGQSVPTTEVDGDIYILGPETERDVDDILWQSANTVRVSFNDSFSLPALGDFIQFLNATNAVNNGSFLVTGLPGGGAVDFTNLERNDATDDELSDSPATSTWTKEEWNGAPPNSWVIFQLTTWISVVPQFGNFVLNLFDLGVYHFNGTLWVVESLSLQPSAKDLQLSYGTDGNEFVRETTGVAYVPVASFIFRGTGSLGSPAFVKVLKIVIGAAQTTSVRLVDVTNGMTIAEVTGLASLTLDILDLGTLSNLPAGEAVFQLEVKKDAAGGAGVTWDTHAIHVQF